MAVWLDGGCELGLWGDIFSAQIKGMRFSEKQILNVLCLDLIYMFLMNLYCFFQSNNPKNAIYLRIKLHNMLINKNQAP